MHRRKFQEKEIFLEAMNKKFERKYRDHSKYRNYKNWPKDLLLDEEIYLIERL